MDSRDIRREFEARIKLTWIEVLIYGIGCFTVVWLMALAYETAAIAGGMQ